LKKKITIQKLSIYLDLFYQSGFENLNDLIVVNAYAICLIAFLPIITHDDNITHDVLIIS